MNVVLIVSDGYPKKFSANNSKGEFIAMGLKACGCRVIMVDDAIGQKGLPAIEYGVSASGIEYYLLPRNGSKLHIVASNLKAIRRILRERYVANEDNYCILGMSLFPILCDIALSAKSIGYKTTTLYHEWGPGMSHKNIFFKTEAYIKDAFFGYLLDCILPIGHFLEDKAKKFNKPMMILPVLGRFDRATTPYRNDIQFTYCGHIGYILRNQFILRAFSRLYTTIPHARLILVVVGNEYYFNQLHTLLQETGLHGGVEVKFQLSQEELYALYDSSLGLLLPLSPDNLQDKARFSQKTAEYVASKRPVITSECGEMPYYFKNRQSAVFANCDVDGYYEAMSYLATHVDEANRIGYAGYIIGKEQFDYLSIGARLAEFFKSI